MPFEKPTVCIIIPARFESSRFPGKPLVKLLGKPMISWVAELCASAVGKQHVYVATDDERIQRVVNEAGFTSLMTSPNALTGTDRLAEAAKIVDYDIYINVQGDEPLVNPEDIMRCIEIKTKHPNWIVNGYCWMNADEDHSSVNVPKLISNETGRLIYMSRAPLPASKDKDKVPKRFKKQVCIYGFSRADLEAFSSFGRKKVS